MVSPVIKALEKLDAKLARIEPLLAGLPGDAVLRQVGKLLSELGSYRSAVMAGCASYGHIDGVPASSLLKRVDDMSRRIASLGSKFSSGKHAPSDVIVVDGGGTRDFKGVLITAPPFSARTWTVPIGEDVEDFMRQVELAVVQEVYGRVLIQASVTRYRLRTNSWAHPGGRVRSAELLCVGASRYDTVAVDVITAQPHNARVLRLDLRARYWAGVDDDPTPYPMQAGQVPLGPDAQWIEYVTHTESKNENEQTSTSETNGAGGRSYTQTRGGGSGTGNSKTTQDLYSWKQLLKPEERWGYWAEHSPQAYDALKAAWDSASVALRDLCGVS